MNKMNKINSVVCLGCLLMLFTHSLCGQVKRTYLPADTLLRWFENAPHPSDVWDSISVWKENIHGLALYDYEAYYHSPKLKPHLLKWLDRNLYAEFQIKQLKESFFPDSKEDSAYITYKIKGRLEKKGSSTPIETILNSTELYSLYTDSILDKIVKQKVNEFERRGKPFPPMKVIYFHMRLAYPESYELIREFWEETGKGTESNRFFIPLVYMGDPEAREIYDRLINEIVETNGKHPYFKNVFGQLRYTLMDSSYATEKLLQLLKVEIEVSLLSDGSTIQFNCKVANVFIRYILYYHIPMDFSTNTITPCEEDLKHLEEIKEAVQVLKERFKKENQYWMKNMPFYERE